MPQSDETCSKGEDGKVFSYNFPHTIWKFYIQSLVVFPNKYDTLIHVKDWSSLNMIVNDI